MAVYLLVASVIFWIGYTKNDKSAYKLSLFILFVITAFRDWHLGGTDAYIYRGYFLRASDWGLINNGEYGIGYIVLNYIVRSFTDNYLIFQIIYAALTIFLLHLVLNKLDISWGEKCVALFGFFCLRFIYNEWISLRQNISNLLFWYLLLCVYQCDKEKRIKRLILIICAIILPYLFHTSAIINLVLVLGVWGLSKLKMETKALIVPIGAFALHATGSALLEPLVNIMSIYISDRYEMYSGSASFGSNSIYFVLRLMFFLFFCYRYHNDESKSKNAVLDIFSMMILIAAIDLEIVSRVFEYYAIGLYAAIGTFFQAFDEKNKNIVVFIFYSCMTVILIRFLYTFNSPPFIPYQLWR